MPINLRKNVKDATTKPYLVPTNNTLTAPKADVVKFRNKISFGSAGPSPKTLEYIAGVKGELKAAGKELSSLSQLDLSKMEDIAEGIDVFKGWTSHDLAFATFRLDSILLQRGCPNKCAHCGADSEPKISTMNWKNYVAMVEGMGKLKDRLGFNIFKTDYENSSGPSKKENSIYPFIDSDPMFFKSPEEVTAPSGNTTTVYHDIYDAAKLFYEKTGTKFCITTAGWEPKNKIAQAAAEKFAKDPDSRAWFTFSVSPFHHYITEAIKYRNEADLEKDAQKKKELEDKCNEKVVKYTDMIANNMVTLTPLVKNKDFGFLLLYDKNRRDYLGEKSLDSIWDEIIKKFRNIRDDYYKKGELPPGWNDKYEDASIPADNRSIAYLGRAFDLAPENTLLKLDNTRVVDDRFYRKVQEQGLPPEVCFERPRRIDMDGSILLNMLRTPDWLADVRFYPVRVKGKRFNLPEPQAIKTQRVVPEMSWPTQEYLSKAK